MNNFVILDWNLKDLLFNRLCKLLQVILIAFCLDSPIQKKKNLTR